jgi:hypothetical protein
MISWNLEIFFFVQFPDAITIRNTSNYYLFSPYFPLSVATTFPHFRETVVAPPPVYEYHTVIRFV